MRVYGLITVLLLDVAKLLLGKTNYSDICEYTQITDHSSVTAVEQDSSDQIIYENTRAERRAALPECVLWMS